MKKKNTMSGKKKTTKPAKKKNNKRQKSCIHVLTGDGGGKTTSALGVAMRSLGHKRDVTVIQFMKGRKDIGEWKFQKGLQDLNIYQYGKKQFVNLRKPSKTDIELAEQALGHVEAILQEPLPPKLLILDELNLAADIGLVETWKVVEILRNAPQGIDIYITGRNAPKEFIDLADFATEISDIKRPKRIIARKGIEY
ncbi:cob(I)yrinic acid a,c-diamide adenosyltransferase [Candidatus Woesearchaeota archaeon]|nr:cob(I)yrinic acid a,c-diamide adenosyltransferase [Candidatus Woesearchaeota archaeon]